MLTQVRGVAAAAMAVAAVNAMAAGVDLTVTSLSGSPASVGAGKTFSLSSTVKTTGAVTRSFTVGFYLSSDSTVTASDTLIGSRTVASLAANGSSTATTTVTVPTALAPGTYYVGAVADSANAVAETNEGNNGRAGSTIQVVGADLTVASLSGAPASAAAGASFSLTSTVSAAASGGNSGPFAVTFYLSTDAVITTSDTSIGARSVNGLGSGAFSTAATPVTIPATLTAGTYYIGAVVDSANQVLESIETNNALAGSQLRVLRPDLTVGGVSGLPPSIGAGDAIVLTDTVADDPLGAAAGPSAVGFYLSTATSVTTSDLLLGTRQVPGLAPGEASTGTTTLVIPANLTPGTYHLGAIADHAGQVLESVESNNTLMVGTLVVGPFSCQHPTSPVDDSNPCTIDACDPVSGITHVLAAGSPCSDGDACTYGDTCDGSGTCVGTRVTCPSDACNQRACNDTPTCTVVQLSGITCDDGNACTYGDVCASGVCAGTPITCSPDACNQRSCNGTASCTVVLLAGSACDDGDPCTYSDTCGTDGTCSGSRVACTAAGPCQQVVCNGTTACSVVSLARGTRCGPPGTCAQVCDGVSPTCQPME